ncbi:hypothetical protein SKAU_G00244900 [Synaphobranchus kaupii]|uniref:Uncharacterized protein n=1 Tax=Synaphobranchus kaupii TaxID=118154 RepID=A0A9Q1F1Z2_SYNKA|nr:hypothetical protein SKAU_G00244900 [Synaphobranchus kaupii]
MDLEELAETASQRLWFLRLDQLKEVCVEAKISSGNVTTRRALIRLIMESIDDVINDEEEDVAKHYLRTMLKSVEQIIENPGSIDGGEKTESTTQNSKETAEERSWAEKYSQLQLNSQALQDEVRRLSERVNSASPSQASAPQSALPTAVNRLPEVTIRREFKICGQIGEKGQKDRLSYTNLMHQIDRGLRKGHSEAEVMEVVVKSISPGLSIRDMLEIKSDLTLPQLKAILKGRESPQNFLFRAIELKERLLLASREVGSDEQYRPELIQKKFMRSVSTGLISDHIKFQLKPYLDNQGVTDEMLIDRMNEAASVESERQAKQKKNTSSKVPKVNELQTELQTSQQGQGVAGNRVGVQEQSAEVVKPKSCKAPTVTSSRDSELYETVRLLREEMAEIRKSINNSQGPTHQVTIINENWRKSCLPHIRLQSTDELLGEDAMLVGKAVNQTPIPFAGWVELKFKLGSKRGPQPELLVPVLVSNEPGVAEPPIIGYNVIERLVMNGMEQQPEVTTAAVREAFSIDCKKANVLIRIVQSRDQSEREGVVKVGRLKTAIPAGQTREVRTGPLPTK